MKHFVLCIIPLIFLIFTIDLSFGIKSIRTYQKYEPNLISIEESVVYKVLTIIEGDILMDKFCECQLERDCALQKRSIIQLTRFDKISSKMKSEMIFKKTIFIIEINVK
jgi:hypothetical protein